MKNVLVTGANKGLGLAIARRLKEDGYHVAAAVRSPSSALEALRAEAGEGAVSISRFDLADVDALHGFVRETIKDHGPLYGLVNNAAVGHGGILGTMHVTEIDAVLRVNLLGTMVLTKYVARNMMTQREGRIVNISSIIAKTGFSGLSVYAASKAGLEGFSFSLARELGKVGITVNCVAPGYMETDMTKGLGGEKLASIRRRSPMGELAAPQDAAEAVAFLMSAGAQKITGTVLTVDAGSTA